MHDILIVGVPLFVILAGILLNRADFCRLEEKMDRRFEALESGINARFDLVHAELRYFHKQEGRHEARLDLLEKRQ